jgi:hypothetical protein
MSATYLTYLIIIDLITLELSRKSERKKFLDFSYNPFISFGRRKISKEGSEQVTGAGGADKALARPGRKQATATEYFDFHISYL